MKRALILLIAGAVASGIAAWSVSAAPKKADASQGKERAEQAPGH